MLLRAPARLSIGLAAAAAILLVFVGIAVFALPTQCVPGLPGAWGCLSTQNATAQDGKIKLKMTSTPSGVVTSSAAAATAPASAAIASAAPKKPAATDVASPSALIDATFAQLQSPTPSPDSTRPAATSTASAAVPAASTPTRAPTTRVVATTVIHPNAVAPAGDALSAYADAPTSTAVDTPATEAAALPPAATTAATADPLPMAAPPAKRPAAAGPTMVVGGGGVTVRSGPSKGRGQLFNLAAGEKVTVGARQRGWVQITDSQGRTGWAYSSLLRNS